MPIEPLVDIVGPPDYCICSVLKAEEIVDQNDIECRKVSYNPKLADWENCAQYCKDGEEW
jgi:hypothetical protein